MYIFLYLLLLMICLNINAKRTGILGLFNKKSDERIPCTRKLIFPNNI